MRLHGILGMVHQGRFACIQRGQQMYGGDYTLRKHRRFPTRLNATQRMLCRWAGTFFTSAWYSFLFLVYFSGYLAGAPCASAESGQGEAPPEEEIVLTFQPDGFSLPVSVELSRSEVRFRAEPDFGGRNILRGSIPTGMTHSEFIGFAWDQTNAELYVDSNQNLDLTDDPGQPFSVSYAGGLRMGHAFQGIHVVVRHGEVAVPYNFNMQFMGTWFCQANVRSGWRGEATFTDGRYQVTIVDNFDGQLGLGDHFEVKPSTLVSAVGQRTPVEDTFAFFSGIYDPGIPACIVVDGTPYKVEGSLSETSGGATVRLAFSGVDTPTGEIRLEGQHIEKLVLRRQDDTSLLYVSGNPIRVPTGTYTVHTIALDGGWTSNEPGSRSAVIVRAGKTAPLKAGGPLKHDVELTTSGASVLLTYTVRGVGGEAYQVSGSQAKPPEFAVYRGDTRIASGNFEYG